MEFELGQGGENAGEFANFLKTSMSELKVRKKSILEKIQRWLDEVDNSKRSVQDKKQKTKEIIDLGNFLHAYNPDLVIQSLEESPDFIVQDSKRSIGIEITDLVIRPEEKEREGILKKMFREIEAELNNDLDSYKGIYRISFKNERQTLTREDKENIKKEIIESINESKSSGTYIKEIRKSRYSQIHLYKGEPHAVGHLERDIVLKAIHKKERNFQRYNLNTGLQNLWLLLTIGGVQKSDDYAFIDESILNEAFVTQFDKVFIFDFFRQEITELISLKPQQ